MSLGEIPTLRVLDLAGCAISDAGLLSLLAQLPTLEGVGLMQNTTLTVHGASKAFALMKSVRRLNIKASTFVRRDPVPALESILQHCLRLEILEVAVEKSAGRPAYSALIARGVKNQPCRLWDHSQDKL